MDFPVVRTVKLRKPLTLGSGPLPEVRLSIPDEEAVDRYLALPLLPGQSMTYSAWLPVLIDLSGLPKAAFSAMAMLDVITVAGVAQQMLRPFHLRRVN